MAIGRLLTIGGSDIFPVFETYMETNEKVGKRCQQKLYNNQKPSDVKFDMVLSAVQMLTTLRYINLHVLTY